MLKISFKKVLIWVLLVLVCILLLKTFFDYNKNNKKLTVSVGEPSTSNESNSEQSLLRLPDHTDHAHYSDRATHTIIYYNDYDCPSCGRFHLGSLPRLIALYPNVSFIMRHNPLSQLHPEAFRKAQIVECLVNEGENFFKISDFFYQHVGVKIDLMPFDKIGTSEDKLANCFLDEKIKLKVFNDQREASRNGLYTTPSAVVLDREGKILLRLNSATELSTREQFKELFK